MLAFVFVLALLRSNVWTHGKASDKEERRPTNLAV
jgi:hypothetical protein